MKFGYILALVASLLKPSYCSLMARIGLRLGGKGLSVSQQVGGHRTRVPWTLKLQREEEEEEWGPKDQERARARVLAQQEEGEDRPPACVGICYYNKLMALEAKEELTRHNEVYKQAVCTGGECSADQSSVILREDLMENGKEEKTVTDKEDNVEEIKYNNDTAEEEMRKDAEAKMAAKEGQDTIYIDDVVPDKDNIDTV